MQQQYEPSSMCRWLSASVDTPPGRRLPEQLESPSIFKEERIFRDYRHWSLPAANILLSQSLSSRHPDVLTQGTEIKIPLEAFELYPGNYYWLYFSFCLSRISQCEEDFGAASVFSPSWQQDVEKNTSTSISCDLLVYSLFLIRVAY